MGAVVSGASPARPMVGKAVGASVGTWQQVHLYTKYQHFLCVVVVVVVFFLLTLTGIALTTLYKYTKRP